MSGVDREPLRRHVLSLIGGDRDLLPGDEVSLVDEGILDSFGLAELVSVIESSYGVKVPDADLKLANFESVAKIAAWVESRGGQGP